MILKHVLYAVNQSLMSKAQINQILPEFGLKN